MNQMTNEKQSVDVVFLDPPRSGSAEQFLNFFGQNESKKGILYFM
jgi:tRNA/tmRNA/rRNA uracil-C5-methylase (TrmA/RlmC/RlmD family)